MASSETSPLVDKFKSNLVKCIQSPSPIRKRKLDEIKPYDSDSMLVESPRKKQRSSNCIPNEQEEEEDTSDNDIDREFNELFEIIQQQDTSSDEAIDSDHDHDTHPKRTVHPPTNTTISNVRYTPRRKRYYDTEQATSTEKTQTPTKKRNITFKCYNCNEVGHIARNCAYDPIQICFKCGESGHSGFYCPNSVCSFCLKSHPVHECDLFGPNKQALKFCMRCGSKQHYLNQCNTSLAHRLAKMQCFVCGQYGHLNCKAKNGSKDKPKRVQLCSNCGDDGHTVYFCQHLPMNKAEIARGLSTNPNEPKICFHCNEANHCSRNCPLIIRQKQQRKKNLNYKFHYRSSSLSNGTKSNANKSAKKKKASAQEKWRKDTMNLIEQYGTNKKGQ
eukprot:23063_1